MKRATWLKKSAVSDRVTKKIRVRSPPRGWMAWVARALGYVKEQLLDIAQGDDHYPILIRCELARLTNLYKVVVFLALGLVGVARQTPWFSSARGLFLLLSLVGFAVLILIDRKALRKAIVHHAQVENQKFEANGHCHTVRRMSERLREEVYQMPPGEEREEKRLLADWLDELNYRREHEGVVNWR